MLGIREEGNRAFFAFIPPGQATRRSVTPFVNLPRFAPLRYRQDSGECRFPTAAGKGQVAPDGGPSWANAASICQSDEAIATVKSAKALRIAPSAIKCRIDRVSKARPTKGIERFMGIGKTSRVFSTTDTRHCDK